MHGWSLGIEQLAIVDERPEIRRIEAALRKYRAELRDDVADDVLRELLYAYREAGNGDLRAYAEFLESEAGRWFLGTVFKAHQACFASAAEEVAADLVDAASRKKTVRPPMPPPRRSERTGAPAVTGPSLPARRQPRASTSRSRGLPRGRAQRRW